MYAERQREAYEQEQKQKSLEMQPQRPQNTPKMR
jgi:hypothetical protein